MARTSLSQPLQIAEAVAAAGVIGMTICPGKKGASNYGEPWARDLAIDMAAVAAWHPNAVVTLMEAPEFVQYGVPRLPDAMAALGARWFHLPIRDVGVPTSAFEQQWPGAALRATLRAAGRVLVHCVGGLGRTGLVAARLLIELGIPAEQAITEVRRVRPGAIETQEQLRYVRACRAVAENPNPGGA